MIIYLADLCYFHDWDNIQPIPLNIGYIAAYLKNKLPQVSVELFKDPIKLINKISNKPPDILALSHYDWNTNLNLAVLKHMKQKNANTITVMGGPNFQPYDLEWIYEFFQKRSNLDVYITGEGEWSFTRFIELLQAYAKKLANIPFEQLPASIYYLDKKANKIINNPTNFVERMDIKKNPSPYLTGILDPFLENPQLAPLIETNRGCPYSCTFCNWGNAIQAKINQFELDTVKKEILYIAEHTKNTTGFFYIADANFGILKRDLEIAKLIRECTDKYNFPKNVFIYFAKNTNDTIINIASTLKTVTSMSMSKQTLNQEVLAHIKRENIPIEQYDVLREKCHDKGIDTFCELIYGLPKENYQSFVNGVIESIRNNVPVVMYPHIMIHGAEASTKQYREKYGFKTAYRVIPRYITSYDDLPSLEYEEIVIETNDLSREDFFRIRLFQFIFFIFRSEIFLELAYGLSIHGLDYATLTHLIAKDEKNWTPRVKQLFDDFIKSAKNELLDEKKLEFTLEDIKEARNNKKALNPFYMSKIVTDTDLISDFKVYLLESLNRFFGSNVNLITINELKKTVQFAFDKMVNYEKLDSGKILSYDYDIASWLDNPDKLPLAKFHVIEPIDYLFKLDEDISSSLEKIKLDSNNLTETIYRLRTNEMGATGDRIFCFRRVPLSTQSTEYRNISRREALRQHIEIAQRAT